MNRQPRLEIILRKLHIPDFMYISPQPASERVRRVRRQEQSLSIVKPSGQMAVAQTIELDQIADTSLINLSPEQPAPALFESAPSDPEQQN